MFLQVLFAFYIFDALLLILTTFFLFYKTELIVNNKITLDLHQLDAAARNNLRDSLLELLYQYRSGPRSIVTQLCLSLACLALQMPEWQNVLPQFTELYGKNPETVSCLLEFLKVLPEEINTNNRIPIPVSRNIVF